MKWITTRRPTEADGDCVGGVWVKCHPDTDAGTYLHWSIVPGGMAWQPAAAGGPDPAPEPVPPGERWPLPRLFAAPPLRTKLPHGGMIVDAIADDGTAWFMVVWTDPGIEASPPYWTQLPPLPQPEAE
jgi:hypothetical protein